MSARPATALAERERQLWIGSPVAGLRLFLRHLPARGPRRGEVLYVNGGTFPSGLAVAHRFDGRSWRDALCEAGFGTWALDLHGFGLSDPWPEMAAPADRHPPLNRCEAAARQVEAALRFIRGEAGGARVALLAHSWGTMPAGLVAGRSPEMVDRLLLFGPIARREGTGAAPALPAWHLVSAEAQRARFVQDSPPGDPVLLPRHFAAWAERWLDGDAESRMRSPPAVKVPLGPLQDIAEAWAGRLAWDPGRVAVPTCILRGAWDSLCTDADAAWLLAALAAAPVREDLKLARGGHVMHLEEGREALHRASVAFLEG